MSTVRLWEAPLSIPTYAVGEPEKNPIFFTGRTYQGAKGPMYPYPLLDKLSTEKRDKSYRAINLQNPYLDVTVLPELGGRIFSGQDRTNGYDFIYRQHVIKPALIGMVGAWISGGAEWDLPHHHRASTFMTADCYTTQNPDGSATIWVGETEWRHRMRWTVGITLFPDRSYIETAITLRNRTPLVNSFLCFTNMAVHATPDYQVIFPPETQFGVQHAKSEFVHWPIARESYGGQDFRQGAERVDVSWWKNHANWISIFAWNHRDDFFGGYDYGRDAGIAHVADHHVAPGKKFFEFGNGTPGQMYDKILTDTDGPYLELMAGAYSDNQPDYSWIQPYEVKAVKQYWYPLRGLGGLKKANRDAALNLEVRDGKTVHLALNATTEFRDATVLLRAGERVLAQDRITISPDKPYARQIELPKGVRGVDMCLSLLDCAGRELVAYQPKPRVELPMPPVVVPPAPPKDIPTSEEVYLAGLRLEQFHSPAAEPEPYYQEVLRRDPGDARANTALGILYYRRGRFTEAREKLEAAIARLTKHYTRVRSGESHYYLGLVLRMQGSLIEAEDALNRAAWDLAWRASSNYELSELAIIRGDLPGALEYVNQSLAHNSLNNQAHCLRALILRTLLRWDEAHEATRQVLRSDPLDFRGRHEQIRQLVATGKNAGREEQELLELMREEPQAHLELAGDYARCCHWTEAAGVLQRLLKATSGRVDPMVHYTLAFYLDRAGDRQGARQHHDLAAQTPPDHCFPRRLESIEVLRSAMAHNPVDARAPYYLGNLLYDLQPQEAIAAWERSRELDGSLATVHRNLALGYARIRSDRSRAVASMEKACSADPADPKLYYELDVLLEAEGTSPQERLKRLRQHHEVVQRRDDALLREISLYVLLGDYNHALELLDSHHFHVWEGGEIVAHDAFTDAHLLRGREHFIDGRFDAALADFVAALEYPDRFEVGRPHDGGRIGEVAYLAGRAYEAMGKTAEAMAMFGRATGKERPGVYLAYYQALASRKLGRHEQAARLLEGLKSAGEKQISSGLGVDFFEKFGAREDDRRQRAAGHYLLALAQLGLGDETAAQEHLAQALDLNPSHLGAKAMASRAMRI